MPVGPRARDLADALAAQPVLRVTRAEAGLHRRRGFYVEVRIPDRVNSAACQSGEVALFTSSRRPPDWWDLPSGEVVNYWILEADGQRRIVAGVCDTTCTATDFEVRAGMAESVTFERENWRRSCSERR